MNESCVCVLALHKEWSSQETKFTKLMIPGHVDFTYHWSSIEYTCIVYLSRHSTPSIRNFPPGNQLLYYSNDNTTKPTLNGEYGISTNSRGTLKRSIPTYPWEVWLACTYVCGSLASQTFHYSEKSSGNETTYVVGHAQDVTRNVITHHRYRPYMGYTAKTEVWTTYTLWGNEH